MTTNEPPLSLIATHTAVTYHFRVPAGHFGWACCTVNDTTGELNIQSDWGHWGYRWDPRPVSLGAPTLTAFIGGRGDVDYLARKLQNEGRGCSRWSAAATVRALRQRLCERRLEGAREQLGARFDVDFLRKEEARRLWDEIGDIGDEVGDGDGGRNLFYARVLELGGFASYVTDEPWEYAQTEQTHEDKALRDIVLPALIAACRTAAPPLPEPQVIERVVAYLRAHAAQFDDTVAEEAENPGGTRYAYVKRQSALVLADRIEGGDWRQDQAGETRVPKREPATFESVVTIDPGIQFGRPTVRGARVKVDVIADLAAAGEPAAAIAREFDLSEATVVRALEWHRGHEAGRRFPSTVDGTK